MNTSCNKDGNRNQRKFLIRRASRLPGMIPEKAYSDSFVYADGLFNRFGVLFAVEHGYPRVNLVLLV